MALISSSMVTLPGMLKRRPDGWAMKRAKPTCRHTTILSWSADKVLAASKSPNNSRTWTRHFSPADVRVVVGSIRCQCLDQAIFRHCGIEPAEQRIVAVKSSVHFRADFESIADKILVVAAPGGHPCRLDNISYHNLRPGVRLGPGGPPSASKSLLENNTPASYITT